VVNAVDVCNVFRQDFIENRLYVKLRRR
jgi:hypothetical protein